MTRNLSLGIDIGTTKVAVVIADPKARVILESCSLDHNAAVTNPLVPGSSEQSVDTIMSAVREVLSRLNSSAKKKIGAVGLTGQMHGVVLFNLDAQHHTQLATWQDARCLEGGFLSDLQQRVGDPTLRSGYGLSTLAWWAKHQPDMLNEYQHASTIHGYLAARMCGTASCKATDGRITGGMDPSDAASFGLFDIISGAWKEGAIRLCGIDPKILPPIVRAPAIFGHLQSEWARDFGIPSSIPVLVPIGDNQASLFGSLSSPETQIALTIGTGAQVSVVLQDPPKILPQDGATYEIRPYVDNTYIAVGASLGGGRTLAALATALQDFLHSLGVSPLPDYERVYSVLQILAGTRLATDLTAVTSFAGERHNPHLRGSLSGISFDNFTLGDIFASLSRGLVESLRGMLPMEMYHGKHEVVGSGNAISRSSVMQRYIEQIFNSRLIVTPGSETTCSGAAFIAGRVL